METAPSPSIAASPPNGSGKSAMTQWAVGGPAGAAAGGCDGGDRGWAGQSASDSDGRFTSIAYRVLLPSTLLRTRPVAAIFPYRMSTSSSVVVVPVLASFVVSFTSLPSTCPFSASG